MKESKGSSVSSQGNESESFEEKNKVPDIAGKEEVFMKRINEIKGVRFQNDDDKKEKVSSYSQEEEKKRS